MAISAGVIAIVNDVGYDAYSLDRIFVEDERWYSKFHRLETSRSAQIAGLAVVIASTGGPEGTGDKVVMKSCLTRRVG
jgi:hypothetical protein